MSTEYKLEGKKKGYFTVVRRYGKEKRGVVWLCKCECGSIRKYTSSRLNSKIGSCGCKKVELCRKAKLESKNPNWTGSRVGYCALHEWVRERLVQPKKCPNCGKNPKHKRGLDLANISQKYKRDLLDWEWLCRKCHMQKDGRLSAFILLASKRKLKDIKCNFCKKVFRPATGKRRSCSNRCAAIQRRKNY